MNKIVAVCGQWIKYQIGLVNFVNGRIHLTNTILPRHKDCIKRIISLTNDLQQPICQLYMSDMHLRIYSLNRSTYANDLN